MRLSTTRPSDIGAAIPEEPEEEAEEESLRLSNSPGMMAQEEEEEEAEPEHSNVELQEMLGVMLGWLAETKDLYKQTRGEMLKLRVDQMGELKQAQTAIEQLAARNKKLEEEKAEAAPEVDLSAWAAECDRLRDGLAVAEGEACYRAEGARDGR